MKVINWIKQNYILLLIVVFGTFLRFYKIDFQSIWLDEICSYIESDPQKKFLDIYSFVKAYDPHPPFYYFSLHVVFQIFGYTTFVMRAFSAILGIAGIISIYYLGKELINKRGGLIVAALTSVNHFHLFYSQEGRMYTLLFLTSTLSFYFLIKFIKKPSVRNSVFYTIFATLLIYSHFFALFVLVSQYLILFYFLIKSGKSERKKIFILSAISGIASFLLWIPALKILLVVAKVESSWIQLPTAEVFSILFKGFFGNAEVLVYLSSMLIIFYFFKIFDQEHKKEEVNDNDLFGFVILIVWIVITLAIPFLRTYLSIPIMIDRYFISILPAVLIMVAIGLTKIKSKLIQNSIVCLFLFSALSDTILVKDYYNKVTKTQFRELTQEIIKKNSSNDLVVSSWAWHLNNFLNKGDTKIPTKEQTLQAYVDELRADPSKEKNFWFVGAHFQKYELSPDAEEYLKAKFEMTEKLEFFDCWANYYIAKSNPSLSSKSFNLGFFSPINLDSNGNLLLFENANIKTEFLALEKGSYDLIIKGNSLPETPIKGENAHLKIRLNGEEIANFYLSEDKNNQYKTVQFSYEKHDKARFQILYDNDVFEDGQDRNAILYSVELKKH